MSWIAYAALAILVWATAQSVFYMVRREYLRRGRLALRTGLLQTVVFALHAMLTYFGLHGTSWPEIPSSWIHVFAALIVGVAGLSMLAAAVGIFGSIGKVIGRAVDGLEVSGAYRWSRNPQIVGYGLFLVAVALLWPSWRMAVSLSVYVGIAYRMIVVEEEHLRRLYGKQYRRYCERTARIIGLFRSR